ncbi:MAG: transposase [Deltaproteobacteria bacterium]|nr:transposase [Deltaproteobacteria bacterium]
MRKIAYLAMDVHARNCVLGDMDGNGNFRGNRPFTTSEVNIIKALKSIKAKKKYLVIEAGPMSNWATQIASDHVTTAFICDPRENALIYKSSHKHDKVDTKKLCRLLRLNEFKEVYRPENDQRAIFKAAVQHYQDLRDQLAAIKQKTKAMYRQWGVINIFTESVYSVSGRDKFLAQIPHRPIYLQLKRLYKLLDTTATMKQDAEKSMTSLGRNYPEIKEFKKMPGMGIIGPHTFDAYIQTPHRFAKASRLWKYCRLGVTDHTSDGKPLGYRRLDKSGIGELKAVSYRAFLSAMKGDNEVSRFYRKSLQRTHDKKHARLNTQRKILSVMLSIWKKGDAYRPELFLDPSI